MSIDRKGLTSAASDGQIRRRGMQTTEAKLLYKARKGDVIAIERLHSATHMRGLTDRYSTWHIGHSASVRKDGVVKTATVNLPTESGEPFVMECHEYDRDRSYGWSALTITDPAMRKAAETLIPCEFASADQLRDAIRAAARSTHRTS